MPASRQATGVGFPCAIDTSIWRSSVTICSALNLFFGMTQAPFQAHSLTTLGSKKPGQVTLLPVQTIDLGSTARLPGDYVAGHALGTSYTLDALPNEATLRTDLQNVVRAYRALTFRGGIEGDVEPQAELEDEFKISAQATVIETRKYAYHRKIERNCAFRRSRPVVPAHRDQCDAGA
jgi:MrcB-like, N-terminal domain